MLRVLIIDDDRDFATDAAGVMQGEGWETEVACSYTEAITKLKERAYDVVSLDIMMPVNDIDDLEMKEDAKHGKETGLLIYNVIRERCPNARVVMCTVLGGRIFGALRLGDALLVKPVGLDDYVSAIQGNDLAQHA